VKLFELHNHDEINIWRSHRGQTLVAVLSLPDYEGDMCHYGEAYTYTVPDEDETPLYEFNIDCGANLVPHMG
jgi:hypothetical protein